MIPKRPVEYGRAGAVIANANAPSPMAALKLKKTDATAKLCEGFPSRKTHVRHPLSLGTSGRSGWCDYEMAATAGGGDRRLRGGVKTAAPPPPRFRKSDPQD